MTEYPLIIRSPKIKPLLNFLEKVSLQSSSGFVSQQIIEYFKIAGNYKIDYIEGQEEYRLNRVKLLDRSFRGDIVFYGTILFPESQEDLSSLIQSQNTKIKLASPLLNKDIFGKIIYFSEALNFKAKSNFKPHYIFERE